MSKFNVQAEKNIQCEPEEKVTVHGNDPALDLLRQINALTLEIRRSSEQQIYNINRLERMNLQLRNMLADRQDLAQIRPQTVMAQSVQPSAQQDGDYLRPSSSSHILPAPTTRTPAANTRISAPILQPKTSWTIGELVYACQGSPDRARLIVENRNGDGYIICEIRNRCELHTQGQDPILFGLMKRLPTDGRLIIVHHGNTFERFTISPNRSNDAIILKLT